MNLLAAPKTVASIFTVAAVVALTHAVSAGDLPDHTLASYLAYAHEHNPMMVMARKDVEAKTFETRAAFSLPGPSLMLESERIHGAWMSPMIGVSQVFPWPAELWWKQRMAALETESADHQVSQTWIMISFDIREAYGMLYETGRSIDNLKKSAELLRQISEVTQVAYSVGKASQSALIKLQIEIAGVESRIRSLELTGDQQRFKLAQLCATNDALKAPYPPELPRLSVPGNLDEIRKITSASNPRVLSRKKDAEVASARARMQRSAAGPMLRVGGAFAAEEGMEGRDWKLSLEAMLPLWPVSAARSHGAAKSMADAAWASAESESAELRRDAEVWFMDFQDRERKIALLDSVLIPRAEEMVSLMMREYRVGMVSLIEVVDAQQMYLMQKTDRVMEEVAREMAAAEIVVCCLALF